MQLKHASMLRRAFGRIGAMICILFFIALLDGCVARFREPLFTVHLLPGWSDAAEGQLEAGIREPGHLRVTSSSPDVGLRIDTVKSGYFLGGNMWIGTISASNGIPPGSYDLQVFKAGDESGDPVSAYRAIIYRDHEALRQSYLSIIHRTFDIVPWVVALACIPALGLILVIVYLLSTWIEKLLAAQGRAEIYRIEPHADGKEVFFGLGSRQGLETGMTIRILNPSGIGLTDGIITGVREKDASAVVRLGVELHTGCLAAVSEHTSGGKE